MVVLQLSGATQKITSRRDNPPDHSGSFCTNDTMHTAAGRRENVILIIGCHSYPWGGGGDTQ